MRNDEFSNYHPLIILYYFCFVMTFTMLVTHPFALLTSLIYAITYSAFLKGRKNLLQNIIYIIPSLILTALVNPAFNHEGATIITYFKNGNPLTLESIYYGIVSSTLLISSIIWFSCFNHIMKSDKIIYLFGKIMPASSLLLSMSMRFVPYFKKELFKIIDVQRCLGYSVTEGSIFERGKNAIVILSVMISKSLENSIETSDSMKSRGYGIKGRSSFSIYKITKRDIKACIILTVLSIHIIIGIFNKALYSRYFPTLKFSLNLYTFSVLIAFAFFASFPIMSKIIFSPKYKKHKGENKIVATDQFTL